MQKTWLAFLPVHCFHALGYGFLVLFVRGVVLAAGQLIVSWFKCCLGQVIFIKRFLILGLKMFVHVLEVFRSFDVLSSSQLHYVLFLWTFEEVLDTKFRFYSRKNTVLGYPPACWQPKHPNQVGSLEFWRSVYSSSTSFFLGFIEWRRVILYVLKKSNIQNNTSAKICNTVYISKKTSNGFEKNPCFFPIYDRSIWGE